MAFIFDDLDKKFKDDKLFEGVTGFNKVLAFVGSKVKKMPKKDLAYLATSYSDYRGGKKDKKSAIDEINKKIKTAKELTAGEVSKNSVSKSIKDIEGYTKKIHKIYTEVTSSLEGQDISGGAKSNEGVMRAISELQDAVSGLKMSLKDSNLK